MGTTALWAREVVLPFAIGACMAAGSLVAYAVTSSELLTEGGAGDMAGAAGALTVILAGGCGFVVSACATALALGLRRGVPRVFGLRCLLSLMAGGLVGLSTTVRSEALGWLAWLGLLVAPALIAWFWRARVPAPPAAIESAGGDIRR